MQRRRCHNPAPWMKSFQALSAWVDSHGRLPEVRKVCATELRLGRFLKTQLAAARKGRLLEEAKQHLARVPGIQDLLNASPRANGLGTAESSFNKSVAMLKDWLNTHGTMPWRTGGNELEHKLARFLSEQRKACRQARLAPDRRQQLLSVPGMDARLQCWGLPNTPFSARAEALELWVASNGGQLPRRNSTNQEEAGLARFLNVLQRSWNKLPAERCERLKQIPGFEARLRRWSTCRKRPFQERVEALKAWVSEHDGQLPRRESENGSGGHELAKFISYHQHAYSRGLLSDERRSHLLEVPGMSAYFSRASQSSVHRMAARHPHSDPQGRKDAAAAITAPLGRVGEA